MPSVPDTDDVKNEAKSSVVDGVLYGAATGVGEGALGGVGHAAGGVVAGSSIGGQKGETLSTLAVANGLKGSLMGGSSNSSGGSRGRK